MTEPNETTSAPGASLRTVSTICPPSPPIDELIDRFWETGPEFENVQVHIAPPRTALELLKQLGPSPFERGGFPLIGFLASTYDRVSQFTLERT